MSPFPKQLTFNEVIEHRFRNIWYDYGYLKQCEDIELKNIEHYKNKYELWEFLNNSIKFKYYVLLFCCGDKDINKQQSIIYYIL